MGKAAMKPTLKSAFDVLMGKDDFDTSSCDYSDFDYELYDDHCPIKDFEIPHHLDFQLHAEYVDPEISYAEFFERFWWKYGFGFRRMTEDQFQTYWEGGSWEGGLHRRRYRYEGLSTSLRKHQVPSGLQLNYNCYHPTDLKQFVNERGIEDPFPNGVTLKHFYVRLLENADRKLTFRFMDLPTEMRLMVYRNLLFVPKQRSRQKVDTKILRTNKEVYKEAKGVLYNDNVFTVAFHVEGYDNCRLFKRAVVHKEYCAAPCDHSRYFRAPEGIDDYPDFLRRISHLKIHLEYKKRGTVRVLADGAWPLGMYLYTLASFLMDGHQLKSIHLKIDMPDDLEEFILRIILYPLRRIRNVAKLTLEGDIPAYIQEKLTYDLKSVEPAFNTMRHWKLLKEEVQEQLDLLELVTDAGACTCGECEAADCVEELRMRMIAVEEVKTDHCMGSSGEEDFIARLSHLRKTLRKIDIHRVKQMVQKLIALRRATSEYERVSDDGRLEEAEKICGENVYIDYHDSTAEDWGDGSERFEPAHVPQPLKSSSGAA